MQGRVEGLLERAPRLVDRDHPDQVLIADEWRRPGRLHLLVCRHRRACGDDAAEGAVIAKVARQCTRVDARSPIADSPVSYPGCSRVWLSGSAPSLLRSTY